MAQLGENQRYVHEFHWIYRFLVEQLHHVFIVATIQFPISCHLSWIGIFVQDLSLSKLQLSKYQNQMGLCKVGNRGHS